MDWIAIIFSVLAMITNGVTLWLNHRTRKILKKI